MEKQKEELSKLDSKIDLSKEFYEILKFKESKKVSIKNKRVLREKFEICQVLRDMLSINESTNWNLRASIQAKYRSIGCCIKPLDKDSTDYLNIENKLISSSSNELSYKVLNVYEIIRPNEFYNFSEKILNQKQLFHGSRANNFVGILSRGLLMPKYVSEDLGNDARSDVGNLGSGIYFSDTISLSSKYSIPSNSKNTRLVALCDVALGNSYPCFDYHPEFTKPPSGFQSVHGMKRSEHNESKFDENEFVIYDVKQYRLRYLIEFRNSSIDGEIKAVNELVKSNSVDTINYQG